MIEQSPVVLSVGVTSIFFNSGGHQLLGRLFLAAGPEPKPTAILLHGIPGVEQNHDIALRLREIGWNSLIFHYRGSWGSEGEYNIETILDDVTAAIDFLCSGEYAQVDPERIALAGHSLGGWAAVMAGARDPRPIGVISIAGLMMPEWIPIIDQYVDLMFTPFLNATTDALIEQWEWLMTSDRPSSVVSRYDRPLMLVHGSEDTPVGSSQSLHIHKLALEKGVSCTTFIEVDGADHAFSWHRTQLIDVVVNWLSHLDEKKT